MVLDRASTTTTTTTATPVVAAAPSAGTSHRPGPVGHPVSLVLPGASGTVPVTPVATTADGAMEIPDDVGRVGWYRFGPAPGDAAGSSVLAGHVDDRLQGDGAFAGLADLVPGEIVRVGSDDGAQRAYRVTEVRAVGKDDLDLDALFSRTGPPRLSLVTCGGAYDPRARAYEDNVVVTTVPA